MTKSAKRTPRQSPAPALQQGTHSSDLPVAFTQAPQSLRPLLERLSTKSVYLTHLDKQPRNIKREMFIFPIFMNLVIIVLVFHRLYLGCFTYPDIILVLLGQKSSAAVDTGSSSWGFLSSVLARRTLMFLFDYILIAVFAPWPLRFLFGPTQWRRRIGFQNAEVIIRQSRSWSESLEPRTWIRDDEVTMKTKVVPAITPSRLEKTGYLLIDADWDLDFASMIRAHELITRKSATFDDFETSVLVYAGDDLGWLIWRVENEDGQKNRLDASHLSTQERDKIVQFREKLAEMGKEDLFFRWVELIQFESTQPGGFTPQRQRNAMIETKQLFESQGVDFEKFWAEVGGMQGMSL